MTDIESLRARCLDGLAAISEHHYDKIEPYFSVLETELAALREQLSAINDLLTKDVADSLKVYYIRKKLQQPLPAGPEVLR